MEKFEVSCDYALPNILREILDAYSLTVYCGVYDITLGSPGQLSAYGDIHFKCEFEPYSNIQPIDFALKAVWEESLAGDLFGIIPTTVLPNSILPNKISFSGKLKKIVGLGEVQHEKIKVCNFNTTDIYLHEDLSEFRKHTEFEYWLPNAPSSYQIEINKKTLEIIGLYFDVGKWVYLFPQRNSQFIIDFNEHSTPEDICNRPSFLAMDKKLQIISVFE